MLEDNKRMKAGHRSFDYTGMRAIPAKTFQEINHGSMEVQMVINRETLEELLMIFVEPENHPDSMAVEASPSPEEAKVRAPCPHADCRPFGTSYTDSRDSIMRTCQKCACICSGSITRLLSPVGELGCKRKGEDGFFMQADLVKAC